jgi:hypothetical protein
VIWQLSDLRRHNQYYLMNSLRQIREKRTRNRETELINNVTLNVYTMYENFRRSFMSPKPLGKEGVVKSQLSDLIAPSPRLTKSDWKEPLKLAQRHSVGDVKIMMKGGDQLSGAWRPALLLEPRHYDLCADAISDNGGKANAAGQQNTERALLAIIQKAMAA